MKIGVKLLKLWNLEIQFWAPILKAIVNSKKMYLEMG